MYNNPSFRPPFPRRMLQPDIELLMEQCWSQKPQNRPNIQEILRVLGKHTKQGKNRSYVDTIMRRLEKYAGDLEDQAAERTESLVEEKMRSEELLRNILPRLDEVFR